MQANYYFIDGSALTSHIRRLRRADPSYSRMKLDPRKFIAHFQLELQDLGEGGYKRATFYFPTGDEAAAEEYLVMPDYKTPGHVRDMHFKFCGKKLKNSAEYTKWVEEEVPERWQDRVHKSEKGIDIEMCCDALKLASASRMERLFILTNDDDFLPFFRTLKEFGTNISVIHLTDVVSPNSSLLKEADSYDIIPRSVLRPFFVEVPIPVGAPIPPTQAPQDPAKATPAAESLPPSIAGVAPETVPDEPVEDTASQGGQAKGREEDEEEPRIEDPDDS